MEFNNLEIDFGNENIQPKWKLTIEELKSCKGFENISDDEAESVIASLINLGRTINLIYTSTK